MITAQATIAHGHVRLDVIYPDKKHHVLQKVSNMEVAQQFVNYLDRQYIVTKLRSWLRQRQKALPATVKAAKLIVLLGTLDRTQGDGIYRFVAGNCSEFESLAPAPVSGHYAYYHDFIKPILEYCQRSNAGEHPLKSER